jgi:hypothetical protein
MGKDKLGHKALDKLIVGALSIEAEEAKSAGAVGFMARSMVQATLPHKAVQGNEFTRRNGNYSLTILAPSTVGLPYGSYPRLLLSWLATEAVRTKEREVVLGESLSNFMHELGLVPAGGKCGSITQLKNQMRRLFSSHVSCRYEGSAAGGLNMMLADKYALWWSPQEPEQAALWKSSVLLSQPFFDEVTAHPVPVDLRALNALKKSPMALDVYMWLTYRMSYLRKPTPLLWTSLQAQYGADYADTPSGRQGFKKGFNHALNKVRVVYAGANIAPIEGGILLLPSKTHVSRNKSCQPVDKASY